MVQREWLAMTEYDLKKTRANFGLNSDIVYLNHASHGPLPLPARKAYDDFLDDWQKTAHNHDFESFQILDGLKHKLAGLIASPPERIALSNNTTFGFNIITGGYPWKRGDNVVLSDGEFPASVYPWISLKPKGVEVKFAPKTGNGFIDEDALFSLVDDNTKIISVSWVQFNNGYRVDLGKIGEFCRDKNILFCVDGIQGMCVIPIDVPKFGIDLFTSGCAKWMCGPCGTGFFYLTEKAEKFLGPISNGWLSVDWGDNWADLLRYNLPQRKGPSKYEFGTFAYQDFRALNASVDMHLRFDRQAVWEHIKRLTDILIKKIQADDRFILRSSVDSIRRSGIVVFGEENSKDLFNSLMEKGFIISFREGNIRVSPHFYNSQEEIEAFITALDNYR